jgi:Ca2+-binding EF-hand superfamily protein
LLSSNGEAITGEDILAFITEQNREISAEEVGCLLAAIDRKGEGQLFLNDFKYFLATLGLKREHEIFDELSPIPALKESQQA